MQVLCGWAPPRGLHALAAAMAAPSNKHEASSPHLQGRWGPGWQGGHLAVLSDSLNDGYVCHAGPGVLPSGHLPHQEPKGIDVTLLRTCEDWLSLRHVLHQ